MTKHGSKWVEWQGPGYSGYAGIDPEKVGAEAPHYRLDLEDGELAEVTEEQAAYLVENFPNQCRIAKSAPRASATMKMIDQGAYRQCVPISVVKGETVDEENEETGPDDEVNLGDEVDVTELDDVDTTKTTKKK